MSVMEWYLVGANVALLIMLFTSWIRADERAARRSNEWLEAHGHLRRNPRAGERGQPPYAMPTPRAADEARA